jgi:sugar phosphate isomerase/epimerase
MTIGVTRIGAVRLADSLSDKEVHLNPGAGNIDFAALFQRLESSGYRYHYVMAFGSLEDKLVGRDRLAAC